MKPRVTLAATFGLPPDTPDNVVRAYAGALQANNRAHLIKDEYDSNNVTPPTQKERETAPE